MTDTADRAGGDVVLVEAVADGVVRIAINRPERRNALNGEVKGLVADAVDRAGSDDSVRVVLLTGTGGIFVAGSDVSEMVDMTPTQHGLQVTDRMFTSVRRCPKPVIAAVEGYALGGGCELAMCADIIVAGLSAKLGQPEVRLGVIPGAGGTQRLVRVLGKFRAMHLLLTGDAIDATEAHALGLVSLLADDDAVLDSAIQLAARIAAQPPLAVRAIKEVVAVGADLPLDAALLLERKVFQVMFDSHDQHEGMSAFLEKRPPSYEGR